MPVMCVPQNTRKGPTETKLLERRLVCLGVAAEFPFFGIKFAQYVYPFSFFFLISTADDAAYLVQYPRGGEQKHKRGNLVINLFYFKEKVQRGRILSEHILCSLLVSVF
jgi:hypothetical protein